MKIFITDCGDLDECYRKKTDQSFLQSLLLDLLEEEEEETGDSSNDTGKLPLVANQQPEKKHLVPKDTSSGDITLDKYEYDKDELFQQQLAPINYDKIETLDSGLTWSVKTAFRIAKIHLIVCVAQNEIGHSMVSRIIIPSALPKGKLAEVVIVNERNRDKEIVEGDNVNLEFNFNDIFYE